MCPPTSHVTISRSPLGRHDSERKQLMQLVGSTKSEQDVSLLMRQHETDRAVLEAQWRGEVRQLQETQRKSYQQWMGVAYDEMTSPGGCGLGCLFIAMVTSDPHLYTFSAGAKKWKPEKSRRYDRLYVSISEVGCDCL